jgi:hypothetical protein
MRRMTDANSTWSFMNDSNRSASSSGTAMTRPLRPSFMRLEIPSRSSFLRPLSRRPAVTAPIAAPATIAPMPIGPLIPARTTPATPPNAAPRPAPGSTFWSVVISGSPAAFRRIIAQSDTEISSPLTPSLISSRTCGGIPASVNASRYSRLGFVSAIVRSSAGALVTIQRD